MLGTGSSAAGAAPVAPTGEEGGELYCLCQRPFSEATNVHGEQQWEAAGDGRARHACSEEAAVAAGLQLAGRGANTQPLLLACMPCVRSPRPSHPNRACCCFI